MLLGSDFLTLTDGVFNQQFQATTLVVRFIMWPVKKIFSKD